MAARAIVLVLIASALWTSVMARDAEVIAVPARSEVPVGRTVDVTIRIKGALDVGSVPFALAYDPTVLEFLPSSSEEGTFLSLDGSSTSFLAVSARPPGGGTAVVVGLSRLGTAAGASGRGVLCRLRFRARAPGVATLSFVRASILDGRAQPVGSVFRGTSITVRPGR